MKDYSNFHETSYRERAVSDGNFLFQYSLDNSLESYDITVNDEGIPRKAILYDKYDDNKKLRILTEHDIVKIGNIITVAATANDKLERWMIVSYPERNPTYSKADMAMCNNSITVKTEGTKQIKRDPVTGKPILDKFGNPQYETIAGVEKNLPCIVEMNNSTTDGKQLVVPSNTVTVTVQYNKNLELKVNDTITLYGDTYKIRFSDKTDVLENEGLIKYIAENISNPVNTSGVI